MDDLASLTDDFTRADENGTDAKTGINGYAGFLVLNDFGPLLS